MSAGPAIPVIGVLSLVGIVALVAWGVVSIRRTLAAFGRLTSALGLAPIPAAASAWLPIAQLARYAPPEIFPLLRRGFLARGRRGDLAVELAFARANRGSPDCTAAIVAAPDALPAAPVFRLERSMFAFALLGMKVSLPAFGAGYVWGAAELTAVARVPTHIWERLAALPREVLRVQASPGMFYVCWEGLEDDPAIVEQAFLVGAEAAGSRVDR